MRNLSFSLIIFLLFSAAANAQQNMSLSSDFSNFSASGQSGINIASLPKFSRKDDTKGSQFLYPDWVKGTVTNTQDVSFSNGFFNYDKINKNLYVLKGDTTFLINKYQVKTVVFKDDNGSNSIVLSKIPSLKNDELYIALTQGTKYSFYKQVATKFYAADYETNGLISKGNNYDEFKDTYTYFIVSPDGVAHQVSLKKKSFKSALETESDKIDAFFKNNSDIDQDEKFFTMLVDTLNN